MQWTNESLSNESPCTVEQLPTGKECPLTFRLAVQRRAAEPRPQEVDAGAAAHLSAQRLESVDVPFDRESMQSCGVATATHSTTTAGVAVSDKLRPDSLRGRRPGKTQRPPNFCILSRRSSGTARRAPILPAPRPPADDERLPHRRSFARSLARCRCALRRLRTCPCQGTGRDRLNQTQSLWWVFSAVAPMWARFWAVLRSRPSGQPARQVQVDMTT